MLKLIQRIDLNQKIHLKDTHFIVRFSPSQNTSLSDKKKVLFEATCLPCHHNCLKCNGPSNRNCSVCKQYKVFLNESSVDPRDVSCN